MGRIPEYKRPILEEGESPVDNEIPEWDDPIAPRPKPVRQEGKFGSAKGERWHMNGVFKERYIGRHFYVHPDVETADYTDYDEVDRALEAREQERLARFLAELDKVQAPCGGCPFRSYCASTSAACGTFYRYTLVNGVTGLTRTYIRVDDKPTYWYGLHVDTDKPDRPLAYREAYDDGVRTWLRKRPVSMAWWTQAIPEAAPWWRAGLMDAQHHKPDSLAAWRRFLSTHHYRTSK